MPGSRETTTEILNARQSIAHAQTSRFRRQVFFIHDPAIACIAEFSTYQQSPPPQDKVYHGN